MNLLAHYDDLVLKNFLKNSKIQREVLQVFQILDEELKTQNQSIWARIFRMSSVPRGIYLHGPVGVGKSFVMDLFFQNLSLLKKKRFHFHHFMQYIDEQLRQMQGIPNPLISIAKNLLQETEVLCIDEFLVLDVGHAMILAELFPVLFAGSLVLVMTTNTAPDALYLNGVHRERFLPVIDAIKKHCQVLDLSDQTDHRLGRMRERKRYFYPLNDTASSAFVDEFDRLTKGQEKSNQAVLVQTRLIPCVAVTEHIVWFEFSSLCAIPRSQLDYLELVSRFNVLFLSNIPLLSADDTVAVVLLIRLVDVFYDEGKLLIISAAVPVDELYCRGPMAESFQRTLSRLTEMQAVDYPKISDGSDDLK